MSQATDKKSVPIEAYWLPGCSSCLRMKEFLEKTGMEYEEINLAANPERGEKLKRFGLFAPAVVVGDRAVPGLGLKGVADLIGYEFNPPEMLSPTELYDKYQIVADVQCRLISQIPDEGLEYKSEDRDRTMRALAGHATSIMRSFVHVYDEEVFSTEWMWAPAEVQTTDDLIAWGRATQAMFNAWWKEAGQDDPLERVVQTFWGHRTLHEVLERSVWHPAQHTRQIALFLERLEITPDRPLTGEDLAGLPVPDRVHA